MYYEKKNHAKHDESFIIKNVACHEHITFISMVEPSVIFIILYINYQLDALIIIYS